MTKINDEIVSMAKQFVSSLLMHETPDELVYHTIDHTRAVVKNAEFIGKKENLNKDELRILEVAAWFHDVGYLVKYAGHEEVSAKTAVEFLEKSNVNKESIDLVRQSILATLLPQKPSSKIAGILCDADMMHLGTIEYFKLIDKLRKEWKKTDFKPLDKLKFEEASLELLENHRYHTAYGREVLQKEKDKNIEILKSRISEKQNKINRKEQKKEKKSNSYSRGVDSMFKLTARNQINLSSIADNKSNILISISLVITMLVRKFEENPTIILPTLIFLVFSLATIVLAILSTRPNISSGKFTKLDISQMKVNLLFFGNFYKMNLDDYEWAVEEMINNDEYLYSTMIKDQYSLGTVLARKYKLLRWSYNVFMIGMIISVVSFILATAVF